MSNLERASSTQEISIVESQLKDILTDPQLKRRLDGSISYALCSADSPLADLYPQDSLIRNLRVCCVFKGQVYAHELSAEHEEIAKDHHLPPPKSRSQGKEHRTDGLLFTLKDQPAVPILLFHVEMPPEEELQSIREQGYLVADTTELRK